MDDLLKRLSEKFGLSDEQSYEAFKAVLEFIQDRLPEPAKSQINEFLINLDGNDSSGNALRAPGSKFTTN